LWTSTSNPPNASRAREPADAGHVHQDVEPPEPFDRRGHDRGRRRRVPDVTGDADGDPWLTRERLDIEIRRHDLGALLRQPSDDRPADPAGGARHQRHPSLESPHARVPLDIDVSPDCIDGTGDAGRRAHPARARGSVPRRLRPPTPNGATSVVPPRRVLSTKRGARHRPYAIVRIPFRRLADGIERKALACGEAQQDRDGLGAELGVRI
jgi:hypothetical protein